MRVLRRTGWIVILFPLIWYTQADAAIGWGPRAGVTSSPDQVHVGAHLDAGEILPRLRFQPNVEIGEGDNLTLIAVNSEVVYVFREIDTDWRPYLGSGLGISIIDREFADRRNDTDIDTGLLAVGGIEHRFLTGNTLFTEMKLGLIGEPDVKWTVGFTFHR